VNKAVLWFTLLLKLSQINKVDIGFYIVAFLGFVGLGLIHFDLNFVLELITNPATLLIFGYSFARDSSLNGSNRNEGEYFALLFCRPITRSSYVLTKALVTAIGIFCISCSFLLLMLIAQILTRSQPVVFIDFLSMLSLIASCWSFGCLMIMLRALPEKISNIALALFLYACAGGALINYGAKLSDGGLQMIDSSVITSWEVLCDTIQQFFYPALDVEALVNASSFSLAPVVCYVSNCLLYLLAATVLVNRREYSYAEN
jgi:hypothetical protein